MPHISHFLNMKPILLTKEQQMYYALRVASAMCFLGHGAFGIITKPIWCNYFGVFGFSHETAYHMMPFVGSIDILCGLFILFYPIRAVFMWLVVWGLVTATLRPLSGEPFAELIERAGNFGSPLALLILTSTKADLRALTNFSSLPSALDESKTDKARIALRIICFLLLTGHGYLNLLAKNALVTQYTALGFHDPQQMACCVGIAEVCMACLILIKPLRPFVLAILIWKMGTELFYPHYEVWEWIERGGSYGALLALFYSLSPIKNKAGIRRHLQVTHLHEAI